MKTKIISLTFLFFVMGVMQLLSQPQTGQIAIDPNHPNRLVYWNQFITVDGNQVMKPYFVAGPGDPETFFYSNQQSSVISKFKSMGAKSTYVILYGGSDFSGTPGTGTTLDNNLTKFYNWAKEMESAGILINFFFFDDGLKLPSNWTEIVDKTVAKFKDLKLLIWCVAEEYQDALSTTDVAKVAARIKAADNYQHIISVHQKDGSSFSFNSNNDIKMFQMQVDYFTGTDDQQASSVHSWCLKATTNLAGKKILNMSEWANHGTYSDALQRKANWACAVGGASIVQVIRMGQFWKNSNGNIGTNTQKSYDDCNILTNFMESCKDLNTMVPNDALASPSSGTQWVLANAGKSYIGYTPSLKGSLGFKNATNGTYSIVCLDIVTGTKITTSASTTTGTLNYTPSASLINKEVAVYAKLTSDPIDNSPTTTITSPANNSKYIDGSTIEIIANASDDNQVVKVEFYNGSTKLGEDSTSPYQFSIVNATASSYSLKTIAYDNINQTGTSSIVTITKDIPAVYYPIPGKVEAENYSAMSGIQLETTTDVGGGKNVGYVAAGDWMDYNINVQTAGQYTFNLRLACKASTGKFDIKSGSTILASVVVPNTGGYQTWTTVSKTVSLSAGQQVIRFAATGDGWNINWFEGVSQGPVDNNPTTTITSPANNANFTQGTPIVINANAFDDNLVVKVEFYQGTIKLGEDLDSPYTYTWDNAAVGSYNLKTIAYDNANKTGSSPIVPITVGVAPTYYTVPGKVEAENYTAMFGIKTETTTDAGGGKNIGYIEVGDWMDYNINVTTAGTYTIDFRIASTYTTGIIDIKSGATTLGSAYVINTGGWQVWKDVYATVDLAAGQQVLRLYARGAKWNINWFDIYIPGTKSVASNDEILSSGISVYPNPVEDNLTIEGENVSGSSISILNSIGTVVLNTNLNSTSNTIDVSGFSTGLYFMIITKDGKSKTIQISKK